MLRAQQGQQQQQQMQQQKHEMVVDLEIQRFTVMIAMMVVSHLILLIEKLMVSSKTQLCMSLEWEGG